MQTPSIEAEPSETLESSVIETLPEVEVEAPSIAIEPAIDTASELSLPPDMGAPPMDIPMDMPIDIPMDIGL